MTEIKINDQLTLSEVQQAFNDHFPYLKIEFYVSAHEGGEGSNQSEMLPTDKVISEVRTKHTDGEISIHGNQKVSTLEQAFKEQFGLHVQVFRKSGTIWLQTTTTDDWTLSEQNETAKDFIQ